MPRITGPRLSRALRGSRCGRGATALAGRVRRDATSASPSVTVTWNVDAQTHLAKLGSDVNVPRGSFSGTIDLATGDLVGNLSLPPAQITLYLGARSPPPTPASRSPPSDRRPATSTSPRNRSRRRRRSTSGWPR